MDYKDIFQVVRTYNRRPKRKPTKSKKFWPSLRAKTGKSKTLRAPLGVNDSESVAKKEAGFARIRARAIAKAAAEAATKTK